MKRMWKQWEGIDNIGEICEAEANSKAREWTFLNRSKLKDEQISGKQISRLLKNVERYSRRLPVYRVPSGNRRFGLGALFELRLEKIRAENFLSPIIDIGNLSERVKIESFLEIVKIEGCLVGQAEMNNILLLKNSKLVDSCS